VIDTADTYIPWIVAGRDKPALLRSFLRRVQANPMWVQVYEQEGVYVFRRASPETPTT
jgi:hypothetical protein